MLKEERKGNKLGIWSGKVSFRSVTRVQQGHLEQFCSSCTVHSASHWAENSAHVLSNVQTSHAVSTGVGGGEHFFLSPLLIGGTIFYVVG